MSVRQVQCMRCGQLDPFREKAPHEPCRECMKTDRMFEGIALFVVGVLGSIAVCMLFY